MAIFYIQKFIKHENNKPIMEPILEHRGKNKGNIKYFKGVYSANQYFKKHNLTNNYYIYVYRSNNLEF